MSVFTPISNEVVIGIREAKTKNIYPLSYGQQLKVSKQISGLISSIVQKADDMSDLAFMQELITKIIEIIPDVITQCSDISKKEFEDEVTNPQLVDIAEQIYEMNFASAIKNGSRLLSKIREAFPTMNSLPTSSEPTQVSPSETSTTEATKTEE